MNLTTNRAARATGVDFHLKVSAKHVDMLNALPEFRDLSTQQLLTLLPKKYRKFVPPVGQFFEIRDHAHAEEDRMARAVIVGLLATETQIENYLGDQFLERTFAVVEP